MTTTKFLHTQSMPNQRQVYVRPHENRFSLRRLMRSLKRWNDRRIAIRQLASLGNDRLLDIGIERANIRRVVDDMLRRRDTEDRRAALAARLIGEPNLSNPTMCTGESL